MTRLTTNAVKPISYVTNCQLYTQAPMPKSSLLYPSHNLFYNWDSYTAVVIVQPQYQPFCDNIYTSGYYHVDTNSAYFCMNAVKLWTLLKCSCGGPPRSIKQLRKGLAEVFICCQTETGRKSEGVFDDIPVFTELTFNRIHAVLKVYHVLEISAEEHSYTEARATTFRRCISEQASVFLLRSSNKYCIWIVKLWMAVFSVFLHS